MINSMWTPPKYLIVETDTLPEVFAKVVYAKQLLENGETNNISQAAKMAGSIFFAVSLSFRNLSKLLTAALGRKNIRFSMAASVWGYPSTAVSQSIKRLPPPIPKPARVPKTVAIGNAITKLFSINCEYLPKGSGPPGLCAAILQGSFDQAWLITIRLPSFPANRAGRCQYPETARRIPKGIRHKPAA